MARKLSAEDKRILAEIEAEQAARKKAKGSAKDLTKELEDSRKARKVPKFNSKGQVTANSDDKKKPAAKKKKAEAKKPAAKKTTKNNFFANTSTNSLSNSRMNSWTWVLPNCRTLLMYEGLTG